MIEKTIVFLRLILMTESIRINSVFISDYFIQKNLNQIITFACWDEFDSFDYSIQLISQGIRISYNKIYDDLEMEKILKVNYNKIGIVYDMDCQRNSTIFEQFSAAQLPFNESYNWLAITTETQIPISYLYELPLTVESELTLVLNKNSSYELYDVYNLSYRHGGKLNITFMGYWDEENRLKNELTQYKYKRRQDFHGIALNISTVTVETMILKLFSAPKPDLETYLTTAIYPHMDTWSRVHYILALYLRDIYNFTINLKIDRSWGYLINGSFNGILGDMAKGEVDIGASSFQYKSERLDVSEFTVGAYSGRLYFYFRHPKKDVVKNPFLKPFTLGVWFVLLSFSVFICILLIISLRKENKNKKSYLNSSIEGILITTSALFQQGSSIEPNFISGRIIFLTLFLWASVMFQFYSADIVGSLLTPPKKVINNLYDLANSELHVAFEDLPYYPDHFRTTTDPASVYLNEKKLKPPSKEKIYTNANDGLKHVREGGYAFYMESSSAYKIIEETFTQSQICELSLSDISLLPPIVLNIVTSKHSPFKKMVIYGLRQLVQYGITKRLGEIWKYRRPNCPESFRSMPVAVSLNEFSPALFIMAAALMFAIFIMVVEQSTVYFRHKFARKCKVETLHILIE